jgi:hypothetical protein
MPYDAETITQKVPHAGAAPLALPRHAIGKLHLTAAEELCAAARAAAIGTAADSPLALAAMMRARAGEIRRDAGSEFGACHHSQALQLAEIEMRAARMRVAVRNAMTIDRRWRLRLATARTAGAPVSVTSLKIRLEAARAAGSIGIGQSLKEAARRRAPPPASQIVVAKTRCPLPSCPTTSANGHGGQHDRQN